MVNDVHSAVYCQGSQYRDRGAEVASFCKIDMRKGRDKWVGREIDNQADR